MEQVIKVEKARDMILKVGAGICNNFNLNDDVRFEIYKKVYHSLSGGKETIELNINPYKGILLVGDLGVGKTVLFKVFQRLYRDTPRKFRYVTAIRLKDMAEEQGCSKTIKTYSRDPKCDLYIDDVDLVIGPMPANFKLSLNCFIGDTNYL